MTSVLNWRCEGRLQAKERPHEKAKLPDILVLVLQLLELGNVPIIQTSLAVHGVLLR